MKKEEKTKLKEKLEKTLGILSAGAIAGSIFMGYNRITGNVISSAQNSTTISLGGVALFILGIVGLFAYAKK